MSHRKQTNPRAIKPDDKSFFLLKSIYMSITINYYYFSSFNCLKAERIVWKRKTNDNKAYLADNIHQLKFRWWTCVSHQVDEIFWPYLQFQWKLTFVMLNSIVWFLLSPLPNEFFFFNLKIEEIIIRDVMEYPYFIFNSRSSFVLVFMI